MGVGEGVYLAKQRTSRCIDRPAATLPMGQANGRVGAAGDPGLSDLRTRALEIAREAPHRRRLSPQRRTAEQRALVLVLRAGAGWQTFRRGFQGQQRTTRASVSFSMPTVPGPDAGTGRAGGVEQHVRRPRTAAAVPHGRPGDASLPGNLASASLAASFPALRSTDLATPSHHPRPAVYPCDLPILLLLARTAAQPATRLRLPAVREFGLLPAAPAGSLPPPYLATASLESSNVCGEAECRLCTGRRRVATKAMSLPRPCSRALLVWPTW